MLRRPIVTAGPGVPLYPDVEVARRYPADGAGSRHFSVAIDFIATEFVEIVHFERGIPLE